MNLHSRRQFLTQTFGLATGGALTVGAVEPFQRRGVARLRLSCAAYSFRDTFNHADPAKRITMMDFVDFCADQGCEGAEVTSYYFPKPVTRTWLVKLKRHAFLRGVDLSGTAIGNNFARPDGPELEREIASVKEWIDHAAVLGTSHVRVFAGDPKGIDAAAARRQCVRALERCGEYAAEKGVWLGLENHGGIVGDVTHLIEIVRAVDCPFVGVNFDSGNFYGPGDPYDDMARLAPYAVNAQIKVEVNRPGRGKEPTDLERVIRILREARYQGWVALEYEAAEDPWKAVPTWLQRMRKIFVAP